MSERYEVSSMSILTRLMRDDGTEVHIGDSFRAGERVRVVAEMAEGAPLVRRVGLIRSSEPPEPIFLRSPAHAAELFGGTPASWSRLDEQPPVTIYPLVPRDPKG